jgi:hypothetical protein
MPVYQAAIEHAQAGQKLLCVIGFARQDTLGGETPAEAAIVAEQVAIAWKARVMIVLNQFLIFQSVTARGMVVPEVSGVSSSGTRAGTIVGSAMPTFVAGRVVFQTATPGRAGRGRTGLPGMQEDWTDPDNPNQLRELFRGNLSTAMNNFVTDLNALLPRIFPVVISRFKGTDANGKPLPRVGGPIASEVTSTGVIAPLGTRVSRIR